VKPVRDIRFLKVQAEAWIHWFACSKMADFRMDSWLARIGRRTHDAPVDSRFQHMRLHLISPSILAVAASLPGINAL